MQIFYLSNRPEVFRDTWAYVVHNMAWIAEAVVVAPLATHGGFASDPRVRLIDESALSGLSTSALGSLDHVQRNVTLRRAAIAGDVLDDTFIMSDDDYRPMKPVPEAFFTGDGSGDIGYYFHDLPSWPGDSTDYDAAQHVTSEVLGYLGAPRRAYGSHMPQIIRRDIWDFAF